MRSPSSVRIASFPNVVNLVCVVAVEVEVDIVAEVDVALHGLADSGSHERHSNWLAVGILGVETYSMSHTVRSSSMAETFSGPILLLVLLISGVGSEFVEIVDEDLLFSGRGLKLVFEFV